jgi:DNA polymerase III epsilon subunit family exonuclease
MTGNCLRDQVFIALDLETTGLSLLAHRIVEVAAVRFSLTAGILECFSTLVQPEQDIPEDVIKIHGINAEMLKDKPTFSEISADLLRFLGNHILIGHNVHFDLAFLARALSRSGQELPLNPVIDSCRLSRKCLPEAPNHKLTTLSDYFKLPYPGQAHRAQPDAEVCAALFKLCLSRVSAQEHQPLSALEHICPEAFSYPTTTCEHEPLPTLLSEALKQQKKLRIGYHNARQERLERLITPILVAKQGTHTYVDAFCHLRAESRRFRLDRVYSYQKA